MWQEGATLKKGGLLGEKMGEVGREQGGESLNSEVWESEPGGHA